MGQFDRQIATAQRLIAKNGRKCVWQQLVDGAPADSDKPWLKGKDTTEDHDVTIVFLPAKGANNAFLQALSDTPINVGEDYGLMAAVDFDPTNRAEIYAEDGTTLLRGVKTVDPLAPNGDIILYTVQLTVAP